jgi:hypothetical protein
MYQDLYYIANADDEDAFREHLRKVGLRIIPERPGGPVGLTKPEIDEDRCRLLSLKPVEEVLVSHTDPYPHYSPAEQPLIEWEPPQVKGKLLIAAHLRHHPYMLRKGAEYAAIGKAFVQIKSWLKANWQPINRFDYMGPGAARLINKEGYSWSAFDPDLTKVEIVRPDGTPQEFSYDQWVKSVEDSNS